MNKQKTKGFSVLITSLSFDDRKIIKQLDFPEEITYSLPISSNYFLWQAFHTVLKTPGKNPEACMKYLKDKSQWLAKKYGSVPKEKKLGHIFQSSTSDFILRDICLSLLSGIDEDEVLLLFKPILDEIDYIVFLDKRLSIKSVQSSQTFLGKENMSPVRKKMLDLCAKMGWKVINLQKDSFQEEHLNEIKSFCNLS